MKNNILPIAVFLALVLLSLFVIGAVSPGNAGVQAGSVNLVFPPGYCQAIAPVSFNHYPFPPALFVSASNENGAGFEVGGQALGTDFGAVSAELDFTPATTYTLEVFWQTVPLLAKPGEAETAGRITWQPTPATCP
jgi:hypothetical protein